MAHAAAWVALPALYYVVLHRPTLLQPAAWPHHRAALLCLVAGATLVVAALPAPWGRTAAALRARALAQVGAMLALVLVGGDTKSQWGQMHMFGFDDDGQVREP